MRIIKRSLTLLFFLLIPSLLHGAENVAFEISEIITSQSIQKSEGIRLVRNRSSAFLYPAIFR